MTNQDAISQAIINLFQTEMFYAEIIAGMKRKISKDVPIAGVCIREYVELHINPETFNVLSLEERSAVLKHECEHILRNHIFRSKEIAPDVYAKAEDGARQIINMMKHKSINIAADCAINTQVQHLPEGAVYPKYFDLKDHESLEWYLEHLKDNEKMKQYTEFDGHDIWDQSEGAEEVLKEKIKQAINKAAERTRAAGQMTAENEMAVQGFNKASVNWKEQLRRFVARTIEVTLESSRKKRNRRYGVTIPGSVKIEDLHIGVAIDSSGSMMEALEQCMAEIGAIARTPNVKVTVIEVDTEVKAEYLYDPKKKYDKIRGGGGTAYQPAFDHFNNSKHEIDAMIYIGDMDNYDQENLKKPKYPVLWAIVGEQKPPADWGSQIRVIVK